MAARETLLLTRSEVEELLEPEALLTALRSGFARYSMERPVAGRRLPLVLPPPSPAGASAMLLAPGLLPGIPAYSVKVHAKFPGGEPAIQGLILLHNLETGDLLAVMDSTYVTAQRTGFAGAIGTDLLARRGAARVAIIGAGAQGRLQLRSLARVRRISAVSIYDPVAAAAQALAAETVDDLDCDVEVAGDLATALADSEIIVTATWASEPFLFAGTVAPGSHITTLGPDQPGKCEVAADLLKAARLVCDDRDLCVEMGAVAGAGLDAGAIHAEIGEVIAGAKPGRESESDITVFGAVGLAFQDLVAAWLVYQKALRSDTGRCLAFLA